MNKYMATFMIALAATLVIAPSTRAADGKTIAAAHKVVEANTNALVGVEVVLEISAQGQSQERSIRINGTVVDESGLTAVLSDLLEPKVSTRGLPVQVSIETKEVKIITPDQDEYPAEVVLKDPDLGISFILPKAEDEDGEAIEVELGHVDLTKGATPKVLDPVIAVNRLGDALDNKIAVDIYSIGAIVDKPRTMYVLNASSPWIGMPVFTVDGELIGITVVKGRSQLGTDLVVLPASDIQKIAKQALEKKEDG